MRNFQGVARQQLELLGPILAHVIRPLVWVRGLWSIELEKVSANKLTNKQQTKKRCSSAENQFNTKERVKFQTYTSFYQISESKAHYG